MASEVEPWGLVVMEPMYLGVPVVATDSGGPTEITDKGRCGVLVPPNNPEEMAGGICRTIDALGTPKLEEQTASARKQIADNYLMSSVVAKTIATYEKAIARR
jgi:glycosyltransferase involved in cell wall biosynthesis